MSEFELKDVETITFKLADGRRQMQLLHMPTGLSAEAFVGTEPSYKTKERLLQELVQKVKQHGKTDNAPS